MQDFAAVLQQRRDAGLYRERRIVEGAQGPEIEVDGRRLLSFCSNDYLGLAADPRLSEALRGASYRYGVGAGAAHLITGHTRVHHDLEEELAAFCGTERALLFSTGYMANLGVIAGLYGRGDTVVEDRLNHASLLDGARLSGARLKRYAHCDHGAAAGILASGDGEKLLATDGVFSMDGDVAPVAELLDVARQQDALLMVDDAHAFGVLGADGRGSVDAIGLPPGSVDIYMATLGKALGCAGAFVAARSEIIEMLIQQARPYVYTTAMPAALAEATRVALAIVREEQWRRDHLARLVARFRSAVIDQGLQLLPSPSPIQAVVLGETERAIAWSGALNERGILIPAIRPPTVPRGTARLRVTFSASHTELQLDRLLDALVEVQRALTA